MSESRSPGSAVDKRFDPGQLDWTIVARPLLDDIARHREKVDKGEAKADALISVVIDLNFKFKEGLTGAKAQAEKLIEFAAMRLGKPKRNRTDDRKKKLSQQYLFARARRPAASTGGSGAVICYR